MRWKPFVFLAFWTAAFLGFGAYRHGLYLRRLEGYYPNQHSEPPADLELDKENPAHPRLTTRQAILLGWTHTVPHYNSTSYVLRAPKKAPGRIRIGIFGDSHVEGVENAKDFDLPTQLQRRFQESGDRRVEIINFGVGGYGLSQAFIMWEFFAERYELDRAVFLVGAHYFARDDTFCFLDNAFSHMHARYVLRGGKPELAAPLGSSFVKIGLRYHGMIPAWRYLRYDARMPVPLRMLLSRPTPSRFNPFYYAPFPDTKTELTTIYRLLLARSSAKIPTTVFFDMIMSDRDREKITDAGKIDSSDYNSDFRYQNFLNAPLSHWSAVGNRLISEKIFAYLAGRPFVPFPGIEVFALKESAERESRPLWEVSDGTVFLDGRPAGRLMTHKQGAPQPHFYEPLDMRARRVAALFNSGGLDAVFVPLSVPPGPADDVVLSFALDGETQTVLLGRASAPSGVVAGMELKPGKFWTGTSSRTRMLWDVQLSDEGLASGVIIQSSGTIGAAVIRLGGREILRGMISSRNTVVFDATEGELIRIRAEAGQGFDPYRIKKTGILSIGKNIPLAGYRIRMDPPRSPEPSRRLEPPSPEFRGPGFFPLPPSNSEPREDRPRRY